MHLVIDIVETCFLLLIALMYQLYLSLHMLVYLTNFRERIWHWTYIRTYCSVVINSVRYY